MRNLLLGFGGDHYLTAMTAVQSKISLEEITEVFPHIIDDQLKIIRSEYRDVAAAFEQDPDLVSQLLVLQSLRNYYRDRFGAGNLFTDHLVTLKRLGQQTNPSDEREHEIEHLVTDNMSTKIYQTMQKSTFEELVRQGYGPLQPSDYGAWVLKILTDD